MSLRTSQMSNTKNANDARKAEAKKSSKYGKIKRKLSKLKPKRNRKNKKLHRRDDFILKYHARKKKSNNDTVIKDISLYDERRTVFISLKGLYQSWKQCPLVVMYSAIFIMPLQKKWVYNASKYRNELKSRFVSHFIVATETSAKEEEEFIKLLKWKDSQGLVFWLLDDYEQYAKYDNDGKSLSLVNPFWHFFSQKISKLYDHVSGTTYSAPQFDEDWWRKEFVSKFDVKLSSILTEFYFLSMKYRTIQEIVYQSNPDSLNPIMAYHAHHLEEKDIANYSIENSMNKNEDDTEGGLWFISSDYNPEDEDEDE